MRTDLQLSHLAVAAGQTARVEISVTNTSEVIEGVTAIVDGINPMWVRLERPLVSLFPDASDSVALVFDIPRDCQAGDYLIDVRIVSAVDPEVESVQDFWLTVTPSLSLDMSLRPTFIRGGRRGRMWATIRNTGNCAADVAVSARDATRVVDCTVEVPRLAIPYQGEATVEIVMRGRRPWVGQPIGHSIDIEARADDAVAQQVVSFYQKPRIPRGLVTTFLLAAIVALWSIIFLWVISELRASADPPKAVPTDFATGPANIPLALIAGTVQGTAQASTTGDGIPRVTVETFRVATDPLPADTPEPLPPPIEHLELVASGATLDDGSYTLRTLIPGTYRIRFSAAGYDDVWYPTDVDIEPTDVRRNLDVVLVGELGSVRAQIEVPDGVDPGTLAATITPTDGQLGQPVRGLASTAQDAADCTVSPSGLVTCTGLPTPGEFTITVAGPGFATQRIDVALGGGTDTIIDTVKLAGEPGVIEGVVTDQDGRALGGATVTVSSGQFVTRVFSQTTDGRFVVDDLPTPNDFVVDFSLAGYSGSTVALPLEAGQSGSASARLIGGFASLSGTVVDQEGNPLGGVDVSLSGATVEAHTSTLTEGASGGGVGSFAFRDLQAPGSYSIALSGPGLQTESRVVRFDDAGAVDLGAITMQTSFGAIEGVVVDPGGQPLGDVPVELTDGVRVRQTVTSTNPAGTFGFGDLAPGSYTITARATDERGRESIWVGQRDVGIGQTIRIERAALPIVGIGSISGTVTDDLGTPLGLVRVTLRGQGFTEETVTLTEGAAIGSYAFDAVDLPGEYLVTFQLASYAPVSATVGLTTSGAPNARLDAELVALPGPVTGTVVDADGSALAEAVVTLSDGATTHSTTTDNNGRFTLTNVAVGTHTLVVDYDDDDRTGRAELVVAVPAGGGDELEPIELTLVPSEGVAP